jgi:hypothetical protein
MPPAPLPRGGVCVSPLVSGERGDGRQAIRSSSGAKEGEDGQARHIAPQAGKQLLLALSPSLRVGVPSRRRWPEPICEAAMRQRVRRVPRARQVRHVEAEVLDLVEPTNVSCSDAGSS